MEQTTEKPVYTMATWKPMIEAMHSGNVFEMDEEGWMYWLEGLPPNAKGWTVVADPDGKIAEIYKGNNRVTLPGR